MIESIPADWREALGDWLLAHDLRMTERFVAAERKAGEVYPPDEQVFEALRRTPFKRVRAVILGQDPYPRRGRAHGLAFSTADGSLPPSLRNILAELREDRGYQMPSGGSLKPWAKHGVLLLNSVLTVQQGARNSHAGHGWEQPTGAIVDAVAAKHHPIVFLLWGNQAKARGYLINRRRHVVIECSHPSPLSARLGFLGSKPFSRANAELTKRGEPPIDWRLDR
ncbi:MAG: uracil-DNA glycosylase [Candidatus Limnocylindrales bacterium]